MEAQLEMKQLHQSVKRELEEWEAQRDSEREMMSKMGADSESGDGPQGSILGSNDGEIPASAFAGLPMFATSDVRAASGGNGAPSPRVSAPPVCHSPVSLARERGYSAFSNSFDLNKSRGSHVTARSSAMSHQEQSQNEDSHRHAYGHYPDPSQSIALSLNKDARKEEKRGHLNSLDTDSSYPGERGPDSRFSRATGGSMHSFHMLVDDEDGGALGLMEEEERAAFLRNSEKVDEPKKNETAGGEHKLGDAGANDAVAGKLTEKMSNLAVSEKAENPKISDSAQEPDEGKIISGAAASNLNSVLSPEPEIEPSKLDISKLDIGEETEKNAEVEKTISGKNAEGNSGKKDSKPEEDSKPEKQTECQPETKDSQPETKDSKPSQEDSPKSESLDLYSDAYLYGSYNKESDSTNQRPLPFQTSQISLSNKVEKWPCFYLPFDKEPTEEEAADWGYGSAKTQEEKELERARELYEQYQRTEQRGANDTTGPNNNASGSASSSTGTGATGANGNASSNTGGNTATARGNAGDGDSDDEDEDQDVKVFEQFQEVRNYLTVARRRLQFTITCFVHLINLNSYPKEQTSVVPSEHKIS